MITLLDWVSILASPLICIAVVTVISVYKVKNSAGASDGPIKVSLSLIGWWAVAFILSFLGVFAADNHSAVPSITIAAGILFPILIGVVMLIRSAATRSVIGKIPVYWLIGIQFYRAFGFAFLAYYSLGMLPAEFALPAGLGDVAVGLLAPLVGFLFYKGYGRAKEVGIAWNLLGVLDLVVAVTMGFLSSPGKFQAVAFNHPNLLISEYPLVMVPVFAVPLSIILHFAAIKNILGMENEHSMWARGQALSSP